VTLLSLREIGAMRTSDRQQFWETLGGKCEAIIFSAAAVDPSLGKNELCRLNYELPLTAIKEISQAQNPPFIATIGSALEGIASDNAYIDSKNRLSLEVENLQLPNWSHVRTHTLLGADLPQGHMLMGQLLSALRNGSNFTIHGRNQFREYLHYSQFAEFLVNMFRGEHEIRPGVYQVGGREKTNVYTLVEQLMKEFNPKSRLLVNEHLAWQTDQTSDTARSNDFELNNPRGVALVSSLIPGWLSLN
jgi:nucleoside-diphosphate-sugar epimerase